ncbi:MAG: cobalamin-independent methionine synthase II family protein [Xanthobacteraceae bacterium]|uniref:cobalamin-independent methionine synthase II family protein n=1 Tax=Pseudolabrys sp. TaxID=1960880 RepID=UPI003D13291F
MPAPRIQTTTVGSYPVPDWLVALPSEQAVIDATRVVIHTQEMAGIDLVCDGELYRFDVNHPETNGMIEYFLLPMSGVRREIGLAEWLNFKKEPGMEFRAKPSGVVVSKLGPGSLDLPTACARAKALATKPLKFTLTGPHMLAKMALNTHYKDKAELAFAIADVLAEQVKHIDAPVIQVDEANLPGSPEEWKWAAESMNRVLKAIPTVPSVHLCFGNYGGQTIQKGGWDQLIEYLNALHVDHIVMENAHRPPQELEVFKGLRKEIGFGLGVVDIKQTVIESADQIARQIEAADKVLGVGRVKYIHPDCGFWMLKRSIADGKIRALKRGRDLYEGRN